MQTGPLSLFNKSPTKPSRSGFTLQIGLKLAVLAVCVMTVFSGHYPPASAQQHRRVTQMVPVLTVEDAVQDNNIEAANKHLETTDANVSRFGVALEKAEPDISGIQGEERGIGALLGAMSLLQIFLQFRKKAEDAE
jgi:hypothetical protein